jgi:N-methylhydantoinase A
MGERRAVVAGQARDLPVWRFDALAPDQRVHGPAIVESDTTTVLLLPGDAARLDARGWLEVAVG